jgi:hypothetical protein
MKQTTETKIREKDYIKLKSSSQQRQQSAKWRHNLWNGSRYLQSMYLIRGCYGLDMQYPSKRLMCWVLVPQLMVLFWEALETLGGET